jgi:hypothetical protein
LPAEEFKLAGYWKKLTAQGHLLRCNQQMILLRRLGKLSSSWVQQLSKLWLLVLCVL